jgi:hypothetical protein
MTASKKKGGRRKVKKSVVGGLPPTTNVGARRSGHASSTWLRVRPKNVGREE